MSYTILNQPTSPNGTITNLVYTVSSSLATQPQFRYVADIYESGSSDLLTRIKAYPNDFETGVFDVAHILNDYAYGGLWGMYSTPNAAHDQTAIKNYHIEFGEEYAPSLSGSATIYTASATTDIAVFPAVVEPNAGSWNFPSASYLDTNPLLSNSPYYTEDNPKPINFNDYEVVNILFYGQLQGSPQLVIDGTSYFIPRSLPSDTEYHVFNIPVGPQNYKNNATIYNNFANGFTNVEIRVALDGDIVKYYFVNAENCNYEPTRFMFINKFGVWEFYTVNYPQNKSTSVDRSNYTSTAVNYNSANPQYDISRRGMTQYYTNYTDRYQVTTDWLTTDEANWLTELIESPNVGVWNSTTEQFIPANITNGNYTWKTNPRGQKVFQYTIEYQFTNKRFSR